jgi:hypothetical protein
VLRWTGRGHGGQQLLFVVFVFLHLRRFVLLAAARVLQRGGVFIRRRVILGGVRI